MKKILTLLLFVSLGFALIACGGKDSDSSNEKTPEKTPSTVVKSRPDDRADAYVIYEADGTEVEKHKSLYAAIVSCVDNCDDDAYVTAAGKTDKLFINHRQYQQDTKDMFWYYSEGTVMSRYTAWQSTYWTDCQGTDEICVFKENASQQLQPYANGYELVGVANNGGSTPVWNSCWYLESNATINLISYSGITKAEYKVDLSQAKVYPSYEGSDQTWAYVGFVTSDSYNVSHQGLRCDTSTGNWYYYSGEVAYNKNEIEVDDSKCVLTSTWDDSKKCFIPDADVTMTMELLTIDDEYIVHRLTVNLSDGTNFVRDYEISALTMCGTIRFTCGLDIVSENTFPDYMNGARFQNVVVSKGVGYVLDTMDDTLYGNFMELEAGEYNLLNSLPASDARLHTIIYTPSTVNYDYSTAGKDVYTFSYDF